MHPFDPQRRRFSACGGFALLAIVLPGCSLLPRRGDAPPLRKGDPPSDVIGSWRAIGKLAARTDDKSRNWSASLDWRQANEEFLRRLSGPFGQGALQVKGRPGEVELTTASGERRIARTPETLFVQETGWDIPASSLRHWITGRARPGMPVQDWTLDAGGRLSSLAQQGWSIEYKYPGDPREHSLPDRITLHGEGVRVRIVVRDWRLE